ncbi:hypothetical protein EJC51_45585 [Streptomyces aquilus]|uniref:Uncharacterized protein n=1 Tax=Streptomyces aquilus TaxID=2548456 RepID=A0A3Q9C7J2_9ACTN|nr:hypothetical protein [Streptomyces aquilus]AZP22690.1 hypothetical protein EJC51_45585 [Streptomyces aquilus]
MGAPIYLIVRSADFVVLTVEWSGFELRTSAAFPAPRLAATGADPSVTLTFPPQAVLEQTTTSDFHTAGLVYSDSRLSKPSRLVFRVKSGTLIELSAQGILDALERDGQAQVEGKPSGLELPWGIDAYPVARHHGALVRSDHPTHPVLSMRSGAVGLWAASLRTSDGTRWDADALLSYRPTASREAVGIPEGALFQSPPLANWRSNIVTWSNASESARPDVTRLELTALGGALSAKGKWASSSWTHDMALGRDNVANGTAKGKLWPFGIPCVYQDFTRRSFLRVYGGDAVRCVAALRKRKVLVIPHPLVIGLRTPTFPFDEAEVLEQVVDLSGSPTPDSPVNFLPGGALSPLKFPVCCRSGGTTVRFDIPLVFVGDTEQGPSQAVLDTWRPHAKVTIPGIDIDLIGADGKPGDVQEVHSLTFSGTTSGPEYQPDLAAFGVVLASLRTLLPGVGGHDHPRPMAYADEMRTGSTGAHLPSVPLVFDASSKVPVSFTANADRSGGLVAPKFLADGISRELGPVTTSTIRERADLAAAIDSAFSGATLFGLPLNALIETAGSPKPTPPQIVQRRVGLEIHTQMVWKGLRLKAYKTFQPRPTGPPPLLDLVVGTRPPANEPLPGAATPPPPTCALKNFSLVLPPPSSAHPTDPLLTLSFASVEFNQRPGQPANLALVDPEITFHGALKLLQTLQNKLKAILGDKVQSKVSTTGITIGYEVALPKAAAGMFVLQNIAAKLAVTVPYTEKPVSVVLGFASREHPFALSITGFSGGGYVCVEIAGDAEPKVEICMEFGAMLSVDFVVARAEVHALGGVRFLRKDTGALELEAFIRIGGSVELLGLVTVSIELRVSLIFEDNPPRLLGRATLVIELDLTLYSGSVTVDSGKFELLGGDSSVRALETPAEARVREATAFAAWEEYRKAFAS